MHRVRINSASATASRRKIFHSMNNVIQFGDFEVHSDRREIRRKGQPVELGGRAFDMLLVFIAHRGSLLTKSTLLDLVWPDAVVDDSNVYAQISAVRAALGPGVVTTIPGRGYRFLAETGFSESSPLRPQSMPEPVPVALNAAPLIGRERELEALADMLGRHRLVTITGPGGVGKSSLVKAYLETLGSQAQGRWVYADLSVTVNPEVVPYLIAQSLGLPIWGVETALPALLAALKQLTSVVVLDCAEHLTAAVGSLVDSILDNAPGVVICVTSRVPLKRAQERILRLDGLELPAGESMSADFSGYAAIALFAEAARSVRQSFRLTPENQFQVTEICRQLDGMPLSIKLAAGRISMFGVTGLLPRVSERLRRLVSVGSELVHRHQSLRATLDWSHDLLLPVQQLVFHRLGIFSAGFTLPLAVAVNRDLGLADWEVEDIVAVLVDHSLVMADGADPPRYRLLTVSQDYAREKLTDAGLLEQVLLAHAMAMSALLEESYSCYWSMPDNDWYQQFGAELSNMRAAISWSIAKAPALSVAMATEWSRLFGAFQYGLEAQRYCERVEPYVTIDLPAMAGARYWIERATRITRQDDRLALLFAERGVELSRSAGDPIYLYQALAWAAVSLVQPMERAQAQLAEMVALEQPQWPVKVRHLRLFTTSLLLEREGRFREALAVSRESLELARECQSPNRIFFCAYHQTSLLLLLGEFQAAVAVARPALALLKGKHSNIGLLLKAIHSGALVMSRELEQARDLLDGVLQDFRIFDWRWFGLCSSFLALLAARQGRCRSATLILGYTARMSVKVGGRDAAGQLFFSGALTLVEQQLAPEEFASLWAVGSRLNEEQVCALALSGTDDLAVAAAHITVAAPQRPPA